MPSPTTSLRVYPTEMAAKKAGSQLASLEGEHRGSTLYSVLLAGEKKPVYLLSTTYRLTVAEQRWVAEGGGVVTKLGTFGPGRNYLPLQTNMRRTRTAPARAEG